MRNYLMLLKECYHYGSEHVDRTGTGRKSLFVRQLRFNMDDGFPLVTTKAVNFDAIKHELLWMLSGSSDITRLKDNGVNIWNGFAVTEKHLDAFLDKHLPEGSKAYSSRDRIREDLSSKLGSVGDIYGPNWRNAIQPQINPAWPSPSIEDMPEAKIEAFKNIYKNMGEEDRGLATEEDIMELMYNGSVDQINNLLLSLRDKPFSSRHVVVAWVPSVIPFEDLSPQENVLLDRGALAPCHMMFQCFVSKPTHNNRAPLELSLHLNIRSSDMPLGLPYNIAQYALLLHMLAHSLGYKAKELIITLGDAHIYLDQLDKIPDQLVRSPRVLPRLRITSKDKNFFDIDVDDIELVDYNPYPAISYPLSV